MFAHTREQRALYRAMVAGREVAVQFLVGGFMSVLTGWLDRGAKESPEQMDAAFRSLALRGLGGWAGLETTGSEPSRRHRRPVHD